MDAERRDSMGQSVNGNGDAVIVTAPPGTTIGPARAMPPEERDQICVWIKELGNPKLRETALAELSKKREVIPDLAPLMWHSFGTVAVLLQEISQIYPYINPPVMDAAQSQRLCNALALIQCFATHPDTRSAFLLAHIPLYLYPFLHTTSDAGPFEFLRLASLGVIGALVKTDEQEVITFLLTTEIIPLSLRIMDSGSDMSKTVATFILKKILLSESGLYYVCQTYDRFSHVAMILGKMVNALALCPSSGLLRHVIRCYLRLTDNEKACEALRQCLPNKLKDETFMPCWKGDKSTKLLLDQLIANVQGIMSSQVQGGIVQQGGTVPQGGTVQQGGSGSQAGGSEAGTAGSVAATVGSAETPVSPPVKNLPGAV